MRRLFDFFYYSFRKIFSYNWRPKFITHWMPQRVQLLNFPKQSRDGVTFYFRQARLKIQFLAPDLAHIWWIKNKDISVHRAINVFHRETQYPGDTVEFKLIQHVNEYRWSIKTSAMDIQVSMNGNISMQKL